MRKICFIAMCLLLFIGCVWSQKPLQLASVFGNGMVLQQNEPSNIWGWSSPLAQITVEIQGQKVIVEADEMGSWKMNLRGLTAGGPFEMKINSGVESITVDEVYVGEVWVASGQSNMEYKLSKSENGEQVVATSKNANIRFLLVPKISDESEIVDKEMGWQEAIAPQVGEMSAVAYYFAENLQKELNVPIGIICAYRGGTPAEAWVSEKTLESHDKLRPIWQNYQKTSIRDDSLYEKMMKEYKIRFKRYNDSVAMGYRNLIRPFEPIGPKHHKRPCGLYHTMLKRIVPYTVRGVIWYQGEGNAERGEQYRTLFPALIEEWRRDFEQPDLPFYFVQLTNYEHPFWQESPVWAELRDAQLNTWQTVKNTAMVVSVDKGDKNDLHPICKQPIGRRLARCALNLVYGMSIPYSGPIYRKAETKGEKMELSFDFVYSGLSSNGESLSGFAICGADSNFVPAQAEIKGTKVVVWSDAVKHPVAVRYGWSNWTDANLFNQEGLPASPFRTDSFSQPSKGIYYPVKIR